jgi:hypothetical protein
MFITDLGEIWHKGYTHNAVEHTFMELAQLFLN